MDTICVKEAVFLENLTFENHNSSIIAKNTFNTWQKGRDLNEKIQDTRQGKISESFIKQYIENDNVRKQNDDFRI